MYDYTKWLQQTLTALGYDPGPIDGIPGPQTAAAVSQFQSDADLAVDGVVGERTNDALLAGLYERINPMPSPDALVLKNFAPHEFACKCGCGLDVVDDLKFFAQLLRNHFGWPQLISSGARCYLENRDAGGVPDSCHLSGEAFDSFFPGHMNEAVMTEMADFAVANNIGVIRYPNQFFCHFQIGLRDSIIY